MRNNSDSIKPIKIGYCIKQGAVVSHHLPLFIFLVPRHLDFSFLFRAKFTIPVSRQIYRLSSYWWRNWDQLVPAKHLNVEMSIGCRLEFCKHNKLISRELPRFLKELDLWQVYIHTEMFESFHFFLRKNYVSFLVQMKNWKRRYFKLDMFKFCYYEKETVSDLMKRSSNKRAEKCHLFSK